jgi:Phage integrase family
MDRRGRRHRPVPVACQVSLLICDGVRWGRRAPGGPRERLSPALTPGQRRRRRRLEIAREALAEHEAKQLFGNSASEWDRERLIFTTASGRPVEPRNIARSFERVVRKAGLRPIRLHDLCHTTASLLKKLGVSPRDAMVILGRSNISATLGIYTHGDEDSRRDALDWLDKVLRLPSHVPAASPADTTVAVTSAVAQADPRAEEDQSDSDLVGLRGLEPRTSSLSGKRSNRLSYSPLVPGRRSGAGTLGPG